jgi:hypothetical protein
MPTRKHPEDLTDFGITDARVHPDAGIYSEHLGL